MKRICLLLLITCGFVPSISFGQTISCDANAVELVGAEINVRPSSDDSGAVQCALEEAVRLGVQRVTLSRGVYLLTKRVEVENFVGQIVGVKRDETILAYGSDPNAFTFFAGSPSLQRMTIQAASDTDGALAVLFTGARSDCSRRVIFAEIDRVDLVGPGTNSQQDNVGYAIRHTRGCDTSKALGSLTINLATFSGFDLGGVISMGDAARVTVRRNEFTGVSNCTTLANSNADFSFLGNTCRFGRQGLVVTDDASVPENRVRVQENLFEYAAADESSVSCITLLNAATAKVSAAISDNRCIIEGARSTGPVGMSITGLQAPSVEGNLFQGEMDGVDLNGAAGAYVNGNNFASPAINFNVRVAPDSSRTITQSAAISVQDDGAGTVLLPF